MLKRFREIYFQRFKWAIWPKTASRLSKRRNSHHPTTWSRMIIITLELNVSVWSFNCAASVRKQVKWCLTASSSQKAAFRVCVRACGWWGGRSIPALPRQYRTGFKLLRALMKVAAYCPADRWFLTWLSFNLLDRKSWQALLPPRSQASASLAPASSEPPSEVLRRERGDCYHSWGGETCENWLRKFHKLDETISRWGFCSGTRMQRKVSPPFIFKLWFMVCSQRVQAAQCDVHS